MAENETIRDAAHSAGAEVANAAAKAAKSGATQAGAAIDAAKDIELEADAAVVRRDLEADLRALREDVARLGETVASIAQSRVDAIDEAVHRSPWSTAIAALCIGFCLGVRSSR
jgi:hypothetical protein